IYEDIYLNLDAHWLAYGYLVYTAASPLPADLAARGTGGAPRRDAPGGLMQSAVGTEVHRDGGVGGGGRAWEHVTPEEG
ncbi:aryl sulfotransferase, partial [Salmonella enterica subsp. enterica serovar Weltevreden]|nr:aryl sulfotransferase [Salmonella enterica subsp. enterica serovar Weltevreden]